MSYPSSSYAELRTLLRRPTERMHTNQPIILITATKIEARWRLPGTENSIKPGSVNVQSLFFFILVGTLHLE